MVKDSELSLLELGFHPWPETSACCSCSQKTPPKPKKTKTQNKAEFLRRSWVLEVRKGWEDDSNNFELELEGHPVGETVQPAVGLNSLEFGHEALTTDSATGFWHIHPKAKGIEEKKIRIGFRRTGPRKALRAHFGER